MTLFDIPDTMDASEHIEEAELLKRLRIDYLQALETEDYMRIDNIIVPRFWEHFAKYYREYEKSWKDVSLSRLPVRLMVDPKEKQQAELGWIDQVLRGKIDLMP
jgi:hypothetical protein